MNAPTGTGAIWRGNGSSFSKTSNFDGLSLSTGDTDLAVAPDDGHVYAVNLGDALTNNLYSSSNGGASYAGPSIAGANSDRPWVTAGRNSVSYVAYHDFQQLGSQNIWVLKSTDGGKTYLPDGNIAITSPVAYAEALTICGDITDRLHIDPSDSTGNTMYLAFAVGDPAGCGAALPTTKDVPINQPWVAKSTDGGMTWTASQLAGNLISSGGSILHLFPTLAIDAAGNVYVAYSKTGPGTSTHVLLQRSTDRGATWSAPIQAESTNPSNVMPAIAAGPAGRIDIAFYSSSSSNYSSTASSWVVSDVRSTNANSASPTFAQTQVSAGIVHQGDICTSGLNCLVTFGNRNLLDFMGVAIDANGLANVVWANDVGPLRTWFGRG